MFDRFRSIAVLRKIDDIISEPNFRRKLHDLIPDLTDFSVKITIKNSEVLITKRKDNGTLDNLVIKYGTKFVEYYYYSTNNFNECGKIFNTKNNIIIKYCYYDIYNIANNQDIKTKCMLFIYDFNLNELFKCVDSDVSNYVIVDGKKVFKISNNLDENVFTRKRQIRTKDDKIITIVETKYYNSFMKKYNSKKYFIDTKVRDKFVNIPSDCLNVRLSKRKYLYYIKKR